MAEERSQRRFLTILAADVAGYSALMEADEKAHSVNGILRLGDVPMLENSIRLDI